MRARIAVLIGVTVLGCKRTPDAPAPAPAPTPTTAIAIADAAITVDTTATATRVECDPRFELISILFRLGGAPEYHKGRGPYAVVVDLHFARFRDHPAVAAIAALRQQHGISFDAPATLAVYLDDHYRAARPLVPRPPGLDARWDGAPVDEWLAQVQDFAQVSGFDAFWASQAKYRGDVEDRFRAALHEPIIAWFDGVFGARAGASYRVVPGLLTGGMNYGVHAVVDDHEDIVQIMFLEDPDLGGLPRPTAITRELLVHEFAHSYVNPIFESRAAALEDVVGPAAARAQAAMAQQHYTTDTNVLDESVVRALVIIYLRDQVDAAAAARSLAEQQQLGFAWMPALVDAISAARTAGDGRLAIDPLVAATRAGFASWLAANPAPANPAPATP